MMSRSVTVVVAYDVDEQTLIGRTANGTYVKFTAPVGDERAELAVGDVVKVYLADGSRIPGEFVEAREKVSSLL